MFCRLPRSRVELLAGALEEEGLVRILGFSPLRLVSQSSLDFLRDRIVAFLARYHKAHPGQRGAPVETLEKRFDAPRTVLVLALRLLAKEERAAEESGFVRLPDFRIPLSAADEGTLTALEGMVLSGELGSVTLDDLRAKFKLTPARLQTLLAALAERKKIVEGFDGFILHSALARRDRPQDPRLGQAGADGRGFQGDDGPLAQVQHPLVGAAGQHGDHAKKGIGAGYSVIPCRYVSLQPMRSLGSPSRGGDGYRPTAPVMEGGPAEGGGNRIRRFPGRGGEGRYPEPSR